MSYYTNIEFTFSDKPPEFRAVLDRARLYLESRRNNYPDVDFVLEQLRRALKEEKGDFKGLYSDDIEGLMEHVSAGFPGLVFYVRGLGEEFPDIWLRLFKDGKVIFRVGPFEDELDSALSDDDD
jgi:hypothetical protein